MNLMTDTAKINWPEDFLTRKEITFYEGHGREGGHGGKTGVSATIVYIQKTAANKHCNVPIEMIQSC